MNGERAARKSDEDITEEAAATARAMGIVGDTVTTDVLSGVDLGALGTDTDPNYGWTIEGYRKHHAWLRAMLGEQQTPWTRVGVLAHLQKHVRDCAGREFAASPVGAEANAVCQEADSAVEELTGSVHSPRSLQELPYVRDARSACDAAVSRRYELYLRYVKNAEAGIRLPSELDYADPYEIEAQVQRRVIAAEADRRMASSTFGEFDPSHILTAETVSQESVKVDWIEGVIGASEFNVLSGRSYVGKTYLALEWAFCVAHGIKWNERPVEQAKVLYLRMEGGNDFADRIAALSAKHGVTFDPTRLLVHPKVVSLLDDSSVTNIATYVAEESVGLVVVDTLNKAFNGQDENAPAPMGQLIQSIERIKEATSSTSVLVLAHPSNADELGIRGHSSLFSALDRQDVLTAPQGTKSVDRTLVSRKNKSGTENDPLALVFEQTGASAVLVPSLGGGASARKIHRAIESLGGSTERTTLAGVLVQTGAYASSKAAYNAIRKAIASGIVQEAVGGELSIA